MTEYAQDIINEVQRILDKHKGFIVFSQVALSLSKDLRDKLYIKGNTSAKIVRKILMPVLEENFVIRKNRGTYILKPLDPEEFVYAWLSDGKPMTLNELVRALKPFTKKEALALLTDMVNAGKVRVRFEDSYKVNFFACGAGNQAVGEIRQVQAFRPDEFTQAKFRAAYDVLHTFREFVRICDLRRSLGWPREVFDGMIRALRDNRTIRVIRADESELTQDEIRDSFIDENKILMGLITWHGR